VKATAIGTAVSASAPLWIVSTSSATEPLARNTKACSAAVTSSPMKDQNSARIPALLASSSLSTASAASWLCGVTRCRSRSNRPNL
jgi:hypothetical protein